MAFIKHGDGKIVSVVDIEDLTEEDKKKIKKSSKNKKNIIKDKDVENEDETHSLKEIN